MEPTKYGWSLPKEECAHGPFDSIEIAMADAQEYLHDDDLSDTGREVEIELGQCSYVKPEDFVAVDLDNLLDGMEDRVGDEVGGFWDDQVFFVKNPRREAEEELHEAVKQWAAKYLWARDLWTLEDSKRVKIHTGRE